MALQTVRLAYLVVGKLTCLQLLRNRHPRFTRPMALQTARLAYLVVGKLTCLQLLRNRHPRFTRPMALQTARLAYNGIIDEVSPRLLFHYKLIHLLLQSRDHRGCSHRLCISLLLWQ